MNILLSIVLVIQVLSALGVIVLVLLQHGKGADMGAAFGSGASGSLFGATGSANFLSRTTAVLAAVFFVCTLALSFISNKPTASTGSVMEQPATSVPADAGSGTAASTGAAAPAAATGAGATPAASSERKDGAKAPSGADIPK